MKKIIMIIMLFCSCGSGMIGLLNNEKVWDNENILVMDHVYVFDSADHTFFVEVIGYYEPNVICGHPLENAFFTELNVWMDGVLMNNGYIGPVQQSLHDEYLNLICGE